MLKASWRNSLYIFDHKLNVLVECWKEGLYIQGIIHDWSKFLPVEFFPYARKFFYHGKRSADEEVKWKYAWLHQSMIYIRRFIKIKNLGALIWGK